jgi:hypothetical protein
MIFPDFFGMVNSWVIAKHYAKKNSRERAEMEKRLTNHIDSRLDSYLKPFMQNLTPEQKTEIYGTVRNSTTAIIKSLRGTVESTSGFSANVTVDSEAGKTPRSTG